MNTTISSTATVDLILDLCPTLVSPVTIFELEVYISNLKYYQLCKLYAFLKDCADKSYLLSYDFVELLLTFDESVSSISGVDIPETSLT